MPKTRPTVIVDIDGTLADVAHRRHYVQSKKRDWRAFNAGMRDDTPNAPVVMLYRTLWDSGDYDLVLLTGRNEEFRKVTLDWLKSHDIPHGDLYMRADRDNRADHVVKEEMLDRLLEEGRRIAFTIDDRAQVVAMWRRRGIACFQCDVGDF